MKNLFFVLFLLCSISAQAQVEILPDKSYKPGEILNDLHKLKKLGRVLYLAAHPDDENTRFISYVSNELGMDVAYLSLTRGDGGQNLIGKEVSTRLGLIRTQELLAARKIDGGQQYFSRAVDFSYSKHPDETFNIWDKDQVMADAVWVIRNFKPDVIVTRFSPDRAGKTHGHHTASAQIALEAYKLAADKNAYPEQLKKVDVWQTNRIVWNTSWWFYRNDKEFDDSKLIKIDVGGYNARLGKSIGEISSTSRSQHRSQGFGSSMARGGQIEYFQKIGDDKGSQTELFDFKTDWSRIKNGNAIDEQISDIISKFDVSDPSKSLNALVALKKDLNKIEPLYWRVEKRKDIDDIIVRCAGFWMDATVENIRAVPGEKIKVKTRFIKRAAADMAVNMIFVEPLEEFAAERELQEYRALEFNKYLEEEIEIKVPAINYSNPYWLEEIGSFGMFSVSNQNLIGDGENQAPLYAFVSLSLEENGEMIHLKAPVQYRSVNPAKGESYRRLEIAPPATVNFPEEIKVFGIEKESEIEVLVKAHKDNVSGQLVLQIKEGWEVEPQRLPIKFDKAGDERKIKIKIKAPAGERVSQMYAKLEIGGKEYNRSFENITYDHFPVQSLYPVSKIKLVNLDLKFNTKSVAYIPGAGDKVAESLRNVGLHVDELSDAEINLENLKKYDAVIAGIRAYNTNERIKFYHKDLMAYVEQGGTYIIQYNTAHRLKTEEIGPYPLKLSRDRVTVEEAPVEFLVPEHPILNTPNKITSADFSNWVHERGLYFPNEWSKEYTPIFSLNDPGEDPKKGSLLVAEHGSGAFIYTGLSWFRELPAGVPGAYRIFANILAYKGE